jgi:hypothetical protein
MQILAGPAQAGLPPLLVTYVVVAGGGGGGTQYGGAGGAGGELYATGYEPTVGTSYTVTVGAGGAAATCLAVSPQRVAVAVVAIPE